MHACNAQTHSHTHATSDERLSSLKSKLKIIEESLKKTVPEKRVSDEFKILDSLKSNPNALYSYMRKLRQSSQSFGPFIGEDGEPLNESCSKTLNSVFYKVFTSPDPSDVISDIDVFFGLSEDSSEASPPTPSAPILPDFEITEDDVIQAINSQSLSSAGGPDGVPASILKNCRDSLAPLLVRLFNHSLATGEVPEVFQTAVVKPLLKSGKSKSDCTGYRPIALTSLVYKAMERCLRNKMQKHLEEHNLLTPNQHGFHPGKSCLTQLLQHHDEILKNIEKEQNVDIIYLDYAKAFDKVDVYILARHL